MYINGAEILATVNGYSLTVDGKLITYRTVPAGPPNYHVSLDFFQATGDITFVASAALLTLSQAAPQKSSTISAGTASLLTMSQAAPTVASFILNTASLMTLSQAAVTTSSLFQSTAGLLTLSQAAAAILEIQVAPSSLLTLSAAPVSLSAAYNANSGLITLSQAAAATVETVLAGTAALLTLDTAPATLRQDFPTPAALITLGQGGVTLDFGALVFNAPNNTMTLDMGTHTVDTGGGGVGDHGNIAWLLVSRKRRME